METKRFSQEDLASGMPETFAQTGNSPEKEEQQVKQEDSKHNPKSNSGKRYAATAGVAAGGAAIAAGAIAGREYLNVGEEEIPEEDVAEEIATSTGTKAEPTSEQTEEPAPTEDKAATEPESPADIEPHELHLGDDENPTAWVSGDGETIHVDLNPNDENPAEVEIKSLGEGEGNEMFVDLDGDGEPDIHIYTEDGTTYTEILNAENVEVTDPTMTLVPVDEDPYGDEPIEEPVVALDEPQDEPYILDDPDDLLAEDEPVEEGFENETDDLLAEDDITDDGLDGMDDMGVDIDMA